MVVILVIGAAGFVAVRTGIVNPSASTSSIPPDSVTNSIDLNQTQAAAAALATPDIARKTPLTPPSEVPLVAPTSQAALPAFNTPVPARRENTVVVSATPAPSFVQASNLSTDDRAVFDRANNYTASSTAYQIDMNGSIAVESGGEQQSIGITATVVFQGQNITDISQFKASIDMTISGNVSGQQKSAHSGLVLADGVMYMNLPVSPTTSAWLGFPMDQLFSTTLGEISGASGTPFAPGGLPLNLEKIPDAPEMMNLLAFASRYINTTVIERTPTQIHFQSTVDLPKFLASSDLDSLVTTLLTYTGEPFSRSDTEAALAQFHQVYPLVLKELRLNIDHYVSISNPRVMRMTMELEAHLSNIVVAGTGQASDLTIRVTCSMNFSNYDQVISVTPPPNATMLPPSVLFGLGV